MAAANSQRAKVTRTDGITLKALGSTGQSLSLGKGARRAISFKSSLAFRIQSALQTCLTFICSVANGEIVQINSRRQKEQIKAVKEANIENSKN